MFKRLLWLCIGVAFGFGLSFWLTRAIRQAAARYSPDRLSTNLSGALRGVGGDLRTAVSEGREAMRRREAELREQMTPATSERPGDGWGSR